VSVAGVFVAGTDTGIGKTHTSVALIHALRAEYPRVCGMKPVASGCADTPHGRRNDDALALQAASDPVPTYDRINPVALSAPVSPHLAAAQEGISIAVAPLCAAFDALAADYDAIVVEGVGGWLAPLGEDLPASALAQAFGLPVILVVGLRLGCLNHAALSARAIVADGCRLLGWIGNRIDPDMAMVDANIATLDRLLPAPCLGVLGHGEAPIIAAARLQRAVAAIRHSCVGG
jgi:dethiobiotin synthetase